MFDLIKTKIRGTLNIPKLVKDGLKIGDNFHAQEGVIIDPGHCWLIEIGDNVTLAPRVHILAHDASTKNVLGFTKIDNVVIGNNVFIGAGTIVLPGVRIGDNVIIGAGSVVTKNLDSGVYAGNPVQKIYTYDEYLKRNKEKIKRTGYFDSRWIYGNITDDMKQKMKETLESMGGGYIV